jgi:hypothetical protein
MKCNDCGSTNYNQSQAGRADVCPECFQLRLDLLNAVKSKLVSMDEFRELQRTLASGNGQAANAIRRVLGLTAPEL